MNIILKGRMFHQACWKF